MKQKGAAFGRTLFLFEQLAAGMVLILALIVLFGWFSHNSTLIQIKPTFAPMRFNTALCFLFSALTLFAFCFDRRKLAYFFSFLIVLLTSLTLAQYLLGVNLGIDELFRRDFLNYKTTSPGRMSPNTAVCFFLFGLAFQLLCLWERLKYRQEILTLNFSGSVLAAVGLVALGGYAFGYESAIGWGTFTMMALHTSAGIALLGATLLTISVRMHLRQRRLRAGSWLALFFLLFGSIASLLLWLAFSTQESRSARLITEQAARDLSLIFSQNMENQNRAFLRFAQRQTAMPEMTSAFWQKDAKAYYEDFATLQAVEWISPEDQVKWLYPLAGNESVIGLRLGFDEKRRAALEAARRNAFPSLSKQIRLVQGKQGFLIYYPLIGESRFGGMIVAVFDTEKFFAKLFSLSTNHFFLEVFEDGRSIYRSASAEKSHVAYEQRLSLSPIGGAPAWELVMRPSETWLSQQTSQLKYLLPIAGIVISFLLSGIFIVLNEWAMTREALKVSEAFHKNLVVNLPVGILTLRLESPEDARSLRIETANEGSEAALGIPHRELEGRKLVEAFPNIFENGSHEVYREVILRQEARDLGEVEYGDARVKRGVFAVRAIPLGAEKAAVVFENVTDRVVVKRRLEELSLIDELTGLHNKRSFRKELTRQAQAFRRTLQSFGLVVVDLDGFKEINDTRGHAMGDRILVHVAKLLTATVSKGDLVSRTGGDEFVIIAVNVKSDEDLRALLRRLIQAVQTPLATEEGNLSVSCSAGGSRFPQDGDTPEKILEKSDAVMYLAKRSGKNKYCLASDLENT